MPTVVTTISQLVRAYNLQNVKVPVVTKNDFEGKIDQTITRDPELYKSSLGTPVVTDLTIKGGSYTDNDGRKITFGDITLTLVLMTVSQSKKIVVTDIQGKDGEIIEYIGMSNYQVSINGIFAGPNGHYPADEVRALQQICKAPVTLSVISTYLQNLDIFNLVIKDFNYDQEAGGYSKQNFTISAMSDTSAEIQFL